MQTKFHPDVKRLRAELKELQSFPLSEKIAISEELISKGLSIGKAAVLWSGGKDSTVLLHLVRKQEPNIIVVHNNTGVEFPETEKFVKEIKEEWNLNLYIAKPKVSFWWCVEKYGYPILGKNIRTSTPSPQSYRGRAFSKRQKKAMKVARISSYCCDWLKKKPTNALLNELGIEVDILGNMVSESNQRWFAWSDFGEFYLCKSTKRWRLTPLYFWRDEDIWEYIKTFNLPYNPLYNMGHKRVGCWTCLMDWAFKDNHLAALRKSHPKLWRFLIVDKGLGRVLLQIKLALRDGQADFWTNERIEDLIEKRPCYFDCLTGL